MSKFEGNILKGSYSLVAAKFMVMVCGLVLTGLLARYLGPDGYGAWAILYAVFSLLYMTDLGMGAALRNRMTKLCHDGEHERARKAFFSLFYFLFAPALLLIGAICLGFQFFQPFSEAAYNRVALFVLIAAVLHVPFSVAWHGFFAFHEAAVTAFFEAISILLRLTLIGLAVVFAAPLFEMAALFYLGYLVIAVIMFLYFMRRRDWRMGWWGLKSLLYEIRAEGRHALMFGVMQVSALLIYNTDTIISGYVAGVAEAGDFSIIQRLFILMVSVHVAFMHPFWAAYALKAKESDVAWLKSTLKRYGYATLAAALVGGGGLVLLGDWLVMVWVGRVIDDPPVYLALFAWAALMMLISHFSIFLNGVGRLERQAWFSMSGALLNIPLSLWLGGVWGVLGVVVASVLLMIPLLWVVALEARLSLRAISA